MDLVHRYIEQLAALLELAGVAIILASAVLATFWFVRDGFRPGAWLRQLLG